MEKTFKLCATTQKSYYGKAVVRESDDGTVTLRSYVTDVCRINPDGEFVKMWGGYSRTTMNHINDFRRLYGLPTLNKREWLSLGNAATRYAIEFYNGFTEWTAGVEFDSRDDAEAFAEELCESSGWRYGYTVTALS